MGCGSSKQGMNILSKQLLYKPQSTPPCNTYEAYYINNGTMTSLGTVTDLSKTFASDEFIYSNVFVCEGNLYNNGSVVRSNGTITSVTGRSTSSSYYGYFVESGKLFRYNSSMSINQIGSATDWIKVCGYANSSSYRAFAEASDGLYMLWGTDSRSRISTLTGWTKITGYGASGNANYYSYGIKDGKLYYLYANGNGAVQQGTDTTWTDITGSYENGSWYGYGINDGKLYALSGTPTQIGSDTTWTKVSGTSSSSGTARALGLNNGKLYTIYGTTVTQVGSSADWQNCSGYCGSTARAIACDSSALYSIQTDGTTTKLLDGDFIYCGQNYDTSGYAVVIRRIS